MSLLSYHRRVSRSHERHHGAKRGFTDYMRYFYVLWGKNEMSSNEVCLLLGATGVGKTLLMKRLQNILCVQFVN